MFVIPRHFVDIGNLHISIIRQ